MRVPRLTAIAALALSVHAAAPVKIICLGDSITRGVRGGVTAEQTFEALLESWLTKNVTPVEVANAGIGGERTDMALKRLARDVITPKPTLITVMYGTNDSAIDAGKTEPRLPIERYEANLHTIVGQLRDAGIKPVLMTPIPLATNFAYMTRPPYQGRSPNFRIIEYVHAVRRVAGTEGVPLIDNFAAWAEEALMGADLNALTTDGCHPNPAGHTLLARTMYPTLAPLLGGSPVLPAEARPPATGDDAPTAADGASANLALRKTYAETSHNTYGYAGGLTDGIKDSDAKNPVYATAPDDAYPKLTTIDLGSVSTVSRVLVHNARDGSTKSVEVSVSADGSDFAEVGRHQFAKQDGAVFECCFDPRPARYVRVSFLDSWLNTTHGSPHFMFLREVEVFAD